MIHSVISASESDDGCSSSRGVKAVLLWFVRLFESLFLSTETSPRNATTFYAGLVTFIKYRHIPTHTGTYMQIPLHTCTYVLTTCRCLSIAFMCMYVQVFHVCAGMTLYELHVWTGIACHGMCKYVHLGHVGIWITGKLLCACIACAGCHYVQVLLVCAGISRLVLGTHLRKPANTCP